MKNFASRLDRIEKAMTPDHRFVSLLVRYGHEKEDFEKRRSEHEETYGQSNGVSFHQVVHYGDNSSYEAFIEKIRCGSPIWRAES